MPMRLMDSSNPNTSRADLKLTDVHPEFPELAVGKRVKDKNGLSPQVRYPILSYPILRSFVR